MKAIWSKFIIEFCKVDFVCHNMEPNWLGWVAIGIAGLIAFWIAGVIIMAIIALAA